MNASKEYYVAHNNQQHGPMPWEELVRNYPPNALVWTEGMANWQPMSSLMSQPPPSPHEEPGSMQKQRHGCVTAWLIFIIVANSIIAVIHIFANQFILDALPRNTSASLIILLGFIGVANVVFAVVILQWKKIGFFGFAAASVVTFIINLSLGSGILQALLGLLGVAILYGVLQIKNENSVSAWELLE